MTNENESLIAIVRIVNADEMPDHVMEVCRDFGNEIGNSVSRIANRYPAELLLMALSMVHSSYIANFAKIGKLDINDLLEKCCRGLAINTNNLHNRDKQEEEELENGN